MAKQNKLEADDCWELVTGEPFETLAGPRQIDHLRGKPPLVNYIIHYSEEWGDLVVRHNLMSEGIFLRVNNPDGNKTQAGAKQFVLDHDKRVRNGDFL